MVAAELIGKQNITKNEIIAGYTNSHSLLNNAIYLSGEMGVGKTYIASSVVSEFNDNTVLIVVPKNVVLKFSKVLSGFGVKSNIYHRSMGEFSETFFNDVKTLIVSQRDFNGMIKTKTNEEFWKITDFLIIDEIQKLTNVARERSLELFSSKLKSNKLLIMTGTIFSGSFEDTLKLVEKTHGDLYARNYRKLHYYQKRNIGVFLSNLWRFISVNLSLDDMNVSRSEDEQSFDIQKIDFIKMTEEERLFYKIVKSRGLKKNNSFSITSYIDNPSKSTKTEKITRATSRGFRQSMEYAVSIPLNTISITKTNKFIKMKNILEDEKGNKTLIYIQDDNLVDILQKELEKLNYKVDNIKNVRQEDYETYIKNSFDNDTEIFVVNPDNISTGIDIEANNIIWYQLTQKHDEVIQAQRRVRRMNSTLDVKIWYLAYNNTEQQTMVEDLSNATKNNAATYGVKDETAISKLTGVLLDI